jgi:acyl-coenzyme A synthetase/AMP-(fatty) acid ligase/thioesterase domain-containing protein
MTQQAQTSDGLRALSETDIDAGILPRLRTVVEAWPETVAAIDSRQSLTFAELAGRACAVAEALRSRTPADRPITMLTGHDALAVACLLGGLLSGRPLLVMDPLTPVPRLQEFASRLQASICVTDDANQELAAAVGLEVLLPPAPAASWSDSPIWAAPPDPSAAAALGFTSGSTGRPKVVALDHRHLTGDAWAGSSATGVLKPGDVLAHTLPLAFAAGMNVTLTGLLAGATLALYDTRALGIAGLADWIESTGVTMLAASPSILRAFVPAVPSPGLLKNLRVLALSGEAAYSRDVELARTVLPITCAIQHRLGSTETGLIAEFRIGSGTAVPPGRLPVGTPTGLTTLKIVDADGLPVAAGRPGRLVITRSYLGLGYWQDPERTAESFWSNPDGTRSFRSNDLGRLDEAGRLHLLGRSDHSVKIRGYLVEPGEVDAVLFSQPDVVEAVTVGAPRPDGSGHRLVAYIVSRSSKPSAAYVRATLRAFLPSYMVPEVVVFLAALPRTDRGKIDRSALPLPPPPLEGSEPATEWESAVAQVWCRALQLENIPRDADFFELGGDSLAAESVIAMVINDLQVPPIGVTPALLVEAPTIAEFARRLHRVPGRASHQCLTTLRRGGPRPPLFLVAGGGGLGIGFVPLVRNLDDDQPVYALHAHALEHRGVPDWSVSAMADRFLVAVHSVQPTGPYYLAGHSFGGVVAFEMARKLRSYGQTVGLLTVLDSFPPNPRLVPAGPALSPLGHIKDAVGLAITGLMPTPGTGQYWRFHRQSQFLSRHYSAPEPYPGRTLVMVANSAERDVRAQWAPYLSGDWRMESAEGDHHSFLREPHVGFVAGQLTKFLAEAQADG